MNIKYERKRILFLKRRKSRFILNEKQFEDYLKKKFDQEYVDIFYNEDLTFKEQISIFSKAKLLIAIHGAGETNIIFMPSTSIVLEISPPNFYSEVYRRVSLNSGIIYYRFSTKDNSTVKFKKNLRKCYLIYRCRKSNRDSNITIDIEKFSVFLEQIIELF